MIKRAAMGLGALMLVACGGSIANGDAGAGIDGGNADGGVIRVDGGPAPDYASCSAPGLCELVPLTCCGKCGVPALSDMYGVNIDRASAYRDVVCKGGTVPCPDCITMEDPNLAAVCRQGTCRAVDVRSDAMSACKDDTDCTLRAGSTCCEACGLVDASGLVALSASGAAELQKNICHPNDGACPPCVPQYPPGWSAKCDPQTKHCAVTKG
jgi:hypothetical protein